VRHPRKREEGRGKRKLIGVKGRRFMGI